MPPLNALRAFEAAARHLSFKEAAAELFVTPTAVSHQIRNLEELVGLKLFERTGNTITLTRAGERFFPVLRDGFDRIAQSVVDLQREEDALTVSVTPAFAAMILIPQLTQLRKLHPGIALTVNATEKIVDLRKFEADLAVRYGPERSRPMRSQLLYRDRYIAVASPAWVGTQPLPVPAQLLAASDLLGYQWKNTSLQGPNWPAWMAMAGITGFDPGRAIGFSEESHAIQGALDAAGVALASSLLVGPELRAGRLVQVHPLGMQGFAYHAEFVDDHPRLPTVLKVVNWLAGLANQNGDLEAGEPDDAAT
ncbi:MAG TPA: LysR substrate-binding domain-containing protein [Burkholderiaceae bacterium]|nr:LysR substrate-binding domain-containing protein [Burkholderiaceae bacterium]